MLLRLGFEIALRLVQPTPVVVMLDVHDTHQADILSRQPLRSWPEVPLRQYRDGFGNTCTRLLAPAGLLTLIADTVVRDAGPAGSRPLQAVAPADDGLPFLQASRYCETAALQSRARDLFAHLPPGHAQVQAICDHVRRRVRYGCPRADASRGAARTLEEGCGLSRDFAHAAIALCRCLGIPARYCTGWPGATTVREAGAPADFAAWFEAWLDGTWQAFDALHGTPRAGRVLVARGRDAADVAVSSAFGPATLERFRVWGEQAAASAGDMLPEPEPAPLALAG